MLKTKLLVTAILATLSTAALAAAPGFYVGGQLGWSKVGNDMPGYVNNDNTGIGGRLFAAYQIDQNWAAELGYTKFAKTKVSALNTTVYTLKTDAFDVVGKGIIPLDNGFNVFGKLGMAYTKAKLDVPLAGFSDSDAKWRPTYGAGVGYDFNQNVTADISWMRIQNSSALIKNPDLISAGVGYHFG